MTPESHGRRSGAAVHNVFASVAVVVAVVAFVVALTFETGAQKSATSGVVTSTTVSAPRLCEANVAAYESAYRRLNNERIALWNQKNTFPTQFPHNEWTSSAQLPRLDARQAAQLDAVMRKFEDVEDRMLRLLRSHLQGPSLSCREVRGAPSGGRA